MKDFVSKQCLDELQNLIWKTELRPNYSVQQIDVELKGILDREREKMNERLKNIKQNGKGRN